jgi:hypothetical protein
MALTGLTAQLEKRVILVRTGKMVLRVLRA